MTSFDSIDFAPPPPKTAGSRKQQAKVAGLFLIRRYKAGTDGATIETISDHLKEDKVVTTNSLKGVGDALGRADHGLGLWKDNEGVYSLCRENAGRIIKWFKDANKLDELMKELGFESDDDLLAWFKSLKNKFIAAPAAPST